MASLVIAYPQLLKPSILVSRRCATGVLMGSMHTGLEDRASTSRAWPPISPSAPGAESG